MRNEFINKILLPSLLAFSVTTQANDFNKNRPDNMSDTQWSNLNIAIEQSKLLPLPEGIGGQESLFGSSVSVDANRALIGASNTAGTGVVYVMEFDGINWQEASIIRPSDGISGDQFGFSVSLSGNRALIGAPSADGLAEDTGTAYIFEYDGTDWLQIDKLNNSDVAAFDQYGWSVSMSGDQALVGAPAENFASDNPGAAYLFNFDGTDWNESQKLVADDGLIDDQFGISVSLSSEQAVIGASGDDDQNINVGSVYVFATNGTNWSQTEKLTPLDAAANDKFGSSVSLLANLLVIGAPASGSDGSAYIFEFDGNNWNETQQLIPDIVTSGHYGSSVHISDDKAFVSAPSDASTGAVYVFDYDGSTWGLAQRISALDGAANDEFASSIGVLGNSIFIGSPLDDDNGESSGSTYVFDYDGDNWNQTQKLIAGDGAANDQFGIALSLLGNRALVGAWADDDNGTDAGAAYVFEYNGHDWIQTQKLTANDGNDLDYFGSAVSLSDDRALISARFDDVGGRDTGSAYIFDFDGNVWTQTQKLIADDGAVMDEFGVSVSLSGDQALIGAWNDDDDGSDSGAAYAFDFDGNAWSQTQKIRASDAASNARFGSSVSLSNNRAVIGSTGDNENGFNSGAAYVFDFAGSSWNETQKLTANDGVMGDFFGLPIVLLTDRLLVGAIGVNNSTGAVYVFDFDGTDWNQTQTLTADDGAEQDFFGRALSLQGDQALVGAPQNTGLSENNGNGAAYLFDFDGSSWSQTQKLSASDSAARDAFGFSVGMTSEHALIGAPFDDDMGSQSGSALAFDLLPDLIFANDFESD